MWAVWLAEGIELPYALAQGERFVFPIFRNSIYFILFYFGVGGSALTILNVLRNLLQSHWSVSSIATGSKIWNQIHIRK